jgi:TolA-binding protein
MIGKAKALLEVGKYDDSRKLFEQIASVREWRGDTTAMAVFQLGEVELRQGKLPEAIAHFRRVFVAYQKFLPWVAKSYLKAAETFDKMGKRQDAVDNLRELLRNEKLQKQPEFEEAKKRLQEWGASA